jgi:hypothetical protein
MSGLGRGLDATANRATRDRRQELGAAVLLALHSIARNARVHGADNDAFDAPSASLRSAIDELIRQDGSFELRVGTEGAFVNRQQVRLDATIASVFVFLRTELSRRGIRGVSAAAIPSRQELRSLVHVFTQALPVASAKGDPARPLSVLTLAVGDADSGGEVRRVEDRLVDSYAHAVSFVGELIARLRSGSESIPLWAASRVVQDLVDLQSEAPLRFLQLARAKAGGAAYWGHHGANVAVLALSFAARLGMQRRRRHDVGMAALFHDVGLSALPVELLYKEAKLTGADVAALKCAPLFAARAIFRQREVEPAALERALGAYETHLDVDGPEPVGPLGRILAICEAYDALTTTRPFRRALSHSSALVAMRGEMAHRFDPRLLELFPSVVEPLV